MKKKLLALTLCLCVVLLAGCQSSEPQRFDYYDGNGNQGNAAPQGNQNNTSANDGSINFDDGSYDPASEEGLGSDDLTFVDVTTPTPPPTNTPAPTVYSQFAGATPVMIDPIDKPTPTVVPPLTFTYQVYDATNLGLSFEGPIGWVADASGSDTYVIYNPDPSMDYAATLTLTAVSVATDYTDTNLKSTVLDMLSSIGATGFKEFNRSNTASRTLIGKSGIYANYTGTLDNGTEIAGRVHAMCKDRVLYTVHITYPRAYTETYKEGVYDKLRNTLKITNK